MQRSLTQFIALTTASFSPRSLPLGKRLISSPALSNTNTKYGIGAPGEGPTPFVAVDVSNADPALLVPLDIDEKGGENGGDDIAPGELLDVMI